MIIGISGVTTNNSGVYIGTMGAGKTTTADYIANAHGYASVGLLDLGKRLAKELFDFSDDQLWGNLKNTPDPRYVHRYDIDEVNPNIVAHPVYLTPRLALQKLGTEFGRACYSDIWIDRALQTARTLLAAQDGSDRSPVMYTASEGISEWPSLAIKGVVFHDIRYVNEAEALRRAGGKLIRVRRKMDTDATVKDTHPSELGLLFLGDDKFDYVIDNAEDLEALYAKVDVMMQQF